MMHRLIPFWFIIAGGAFELLGQNLVSNSHFEVWGHWATEGSAHPRNRWRSHEPGRYTGAILGGWATRGNAGSIKQSGIPVIPSQRYLLRAWIWLDQGWHPATQEVMVHYVGADDENITSVRIPIVHGVRGWAPIRLVLVAPPAAHSATIEFRASDISYHGSMAVDDVYFGSVN